MLIFIFPLINDVRLFFQRYNLLVYYIIDIYSFIRKLETERE